MSFKSDIKYQRSVLVIGFVLMFVKVLAYQITHSNAILSDALESLVNISSGSFALFSLWVAAKPSDKNHPYGHGKVEFISGFVEGTLIVVAGLMMIGKAVYNLIYPHEVTDLLLGILLTAVAGLVNFLMGYGLKKKGEEKASMTMKSEGAHLMSDGYTSAALIIGIAVVWITKLPFLDNVVTIIFGLYILFLGYKIFKESIAGIMDEMDMVLVDSIVKKLNDNRKEEWVDVHNLRVLKFGRDIHIDCHLTLPWYNNLEESHAQVDLFERSLQQEFSQSTEFFVHADPCVEKSCEICILSSCQHRKRKLERKIDWTAENIIANRKHDNE